MRIVCLLAIGLMLGALATLPASRAAGAPRNASTVTPAALINLGAIFGEDENEPDEDESDEGNRERQQPAGGNPDHRLGASLPVVLVIAALGVMAAAFVVNRLRRLWRRLRGLSARASARARGWGGGSSRPRL
jgi:hypothetical protein